MLAMKIYIDETVHEQLGSMILAYVTFKSDPQSEMDQIREFYKKDEFHFLEKSEVANFKVKTIVCNRLHAMFQDKSKMLGPSSSLRKLGILYIFDQMSITYSSRGILYNALSA